MHEKSPTDTAEPSPQPKPLRFWLAFLALCLLGLSTALEATIVTTALPVIAKTMDVGSKYVWVGSAFLLASTIVQPFIGQLADIYGRRWPLILLTSCFVLGSGIAGGANGAGMLVGGRTVQGLGAGGILVLIDVVVSDLLPLQERGKFMGLVRMMGALGSAIGPLVGGGIAKANWRWCFYLNVVTGGLALVYLIFFLRLRHEVKSWRVGLARIDHVGAVLFTSSITALLLGLTMGGVVYPWSSARVIAPIVLGCVGWVVFHVYESIGLCKEPMVPSRLFTTRTSVAGYFMAFDGALLLYWVIWFLPVYFQGVLGASPLRSGVDQLPFNMFLVPSGIVAGGIITKTGNYRAQHFAGFALASVGVGLFTLLQVESVKTAWVCFQIIAAIGLGFILVTVLPAVQAALTDDDVARTTATYAFVRSFGGVWGVTIPSIIFNARVDELSRDIGSTDVRSQIINGHAYGFAAAGSVQKLAQPFRGQVLNIYSDALKTVWQVAIPFALAGFLAACAIKQYDMSRKHDAKFGLKEDQTATDSAFEEGHGKELDPSTSAEVFMPKQCIPRSSNLLDAMIGQSTYNVARSYLRHESMGDLASAIIHDNGCGTGALTRAILESRPEVTQTTPSAIIHATDINASFVDDFRKVVAARGWEDLVRPATMAAEALDLPDASLTHSFTNFVIFGARDSAKVADEVFRTLRPKGIAVMTTWAQLPHTQALDHTRERLYGEHGTRHIDPKWQHLSTLQQTLETAGFTTLKAINIDSELVHDDMDTWTQLAWSWMGMPHGGWTQSEESNWDKHRATFGEECLRSGFMLGEDGKLRCSLVANVIIAQK